MRIRCRQNELARTEQAIKKLSVGAFVGTQIEPARAPRSNQGNQVEPTTNAQGTQIEPVEAKLGQAGRAKSLGRSPRSLEAARPSQPATRTSQDGSARRSSWVTSLLMVNPGSTQFLQFCPKNVPKRSKTAENARKRPKTIENG